jgi:Mrp family chromosome partitioning ATPase
MSSPSNLFGHLGRTARHARNVLSDPALSDPFAADLYAVQRWFGRTARKIKKILVEPANFVDPSFQGSYLPLIQKLVHARQEARNGRLFAFTSACGGEGVSYVVEAIAWEIARQTEEEVLIATASSMPGLLSADFRDASNGFGGTKVWRVYETPSKCLAPPKIPCELTELLRRRFGYVLIDCPALGASASALSVARACDGVLLVVAAGQTTRDRIEQAQQSLQAASCPLLGLILNKRTYPVPGFLSRHL